MNSRALRTGLALLLLVWEAETCVFALERLEPTDGCYLGVNLGSTVPISRLASRLGITPAVSGRFFVFPLSSTDRGSLTNFLNEVLNNGGIAMITLLPQQGLEAVSPAVCADLGTLCATYEQLGIDGIFLRFGHEMNGNWYPWGQQPILYKQEFQLLAQNVHSRTARTAMLWAPSYGIGYPFGSPRVAPGSTDFAALDTNGDNALNQADDMYEPYYPGDDAVDWVGLTLYHWGVTYPWFENELPPANSFADSLTGTYQGTIPNFYARYCVDGVHNKPMAIPETAAFYNTQQPGPGEFNLKQAWWQQVFNIEGDTPAGLDVALHFPKLKCIAWFDQYKQEVEARNNWIDWRVSADQRIRAAFVADVRKLRNGRSYFLTAQEAHWQTSAYAISASDLPRILPLTGSVSVSLNAKAQAPCDLVIDLLDPNFQWQGGTRVAITGSAQIVSTSFPLIQALRDGGLYRWSIFLTPTGQGYQHALAWYKGPQPAARMLRPAIEISACPPVIAAQSNVNVRVKYVTAEPAFVVVTLVDDTSRQVGRGIVAVPKGDGRIDVPLALPSEAATGTRWLEAFLSDSSENLNTPITHSSKLSLPIRSSTDIDLIGAAAEPSVVPTGEVLRFEVGYAASTNRDLHIDLFDASTNYLDSAVQPVVAGSGVCDMTISFPQAAPGEYFISAFMSPTGQSWTQAVAWSQQQRVTIIGTAYQQWAESFWGTVLENDPIRPQDDPDGDGATNAYEFLTQTDPRNGQSVLKVNLARTKTGLTVSWPSVAGRTYQLLQSTNANGGLWTPLDGPLTGTGTVIEVAVNPKGSISFYRVQFVK
jgi:hypothetical protein